METTLFSEYEANIRLSDLVLDAGTQQRVEISEDTVSDYLRKTDSVLCTFIKTFFVVNRCFVVE
jgi:hypothetical protein